MAKTTNKTPDTLDVSESETAPVVRPTDLETYYGRTRSQTQELMLNIVRDQAQRGQLHPIPDLLKRLTLYAEKKGRGDLINLARLVRLRALKAQSDKKLPSHVYTDESHRRLGHLVQVCEQILEPVPDTLPTPIT